MEVLQRAERVALLEAVVAGVFLTLPVLVAIGLPGALTPIPPPLTCGVLLVGFASCARLVEAAVIRGKWGAMGLSILAAVTFGVFVYVTLTYCPGGR
jgi:hypothetical protein